MSIFLNIPEGPWILGISGLSLTDQEIQKLQQPGVSGVLLFTRNYENPAQLKQLTHAIHAIKSPRLLIYVDQEGGRVQRFQAGFTPLPSLRHWGELYHQLPNAALKGAFSHGFTLASELLQWGVDVSFAPVIDLYNPISKVIGTRAFDAHPHIVTLLARSMIEGLHEAGMPAILKHFPGHGNLVGDTHVESATDDTHDLQSLLKTDLWPFQALAPEVEGIMVAHARYTHIDPHHIASQSQIWIQDLLKGQWGFQGKIFSDDLSMEASKTSDFNAVCNKTLAAGCDFLVCGWDLEAR